MNLSRFLILSPFSSSQDARMPQFVQPWFQHNLFALKWYPGEFARFFGSYSVLNIDIWGIISKGPHHIPALRGRLPREYDKLYYNSLNE